jgi:hypothetical protein
MNDRFYVFNDSNGNQIELHDIGSFNKGRIGANKLLEQSISVLGCGKSVLVDSQNNILAGAKVVDAARKTGIKKIRVIETKGDELVVVKRTDVNARTKKGCELSLVDNLSQDKNLSWDADAICDKMQEILSFNPREWGGHSCLVKELDIETLLKDDVEKKRNTTSQKSDIQLDVQQYSLF